RPSRQPARTGERRVGGSRFGEPVAEAAHRLDPGGIAELAPQRADVDIDGLGGDEPGSPDAVEQLVAAEDGLGPFEQRSEQVELAAGQFDLVAVDAETARLRL